MDKIAISASSSLYPPLSSEQGQVSLQETFLRTCFNCGSNKTSAWYKNPLDEKQNECKKCHDAAQKVLAQSGASGRVCFNCGATKTYQWYRNPEDKTQSQCAPCRKIKKRPATVASQSSNSLDTTSDLTPSGKRKKVDVSTSSSIIPLEKLMANDEINWNVAPVNKDPNEIAVSSSSYHSRYFSKEEEDLLQQMLIRTCFNCKSTTSPLWYKNLFNASQDQCSKCYDVTRSTFNQSGLSGRICGDCGTAATSRWYKNKTQDQCQSCYNAARKALAQSGGSGRVCFSCGTTASSQWFKNPSDKTQDQCHKCYDATRAAFNQSGLSGKICGDCRTAATPKWYKNKTQDQCQSCYHAARKALAQSGESGRVCFSCGTTAPSRWFKNPSDKTQDQCRRCYDKIKKLAEKSQSSTFFASEEFDFDSP